MSQRQSDPSKVSSKGRTVGWNEPSRDAKQAELGVLDERNDAMINRVLRDTYRIVSSLDEGGMGKLYRAEHLRLRRPVAVKFMTRNLAANTEALARFRREAEIISQLDHPHIVHILDFDTTDDGAPYIVMELLMGVTLSQRLSEQGTLPLRDTVEIAMQISSGLMLAHASKIVHRDLKPDNVFLLSMSDRRVFVKLLDFGISTGTTAGARLTGRYDVLGTPDYMAPEQAIDTSKVDHRADQWSLACLVYEMLTGSTPFPGETVVDVLSKVVNVAPLPLTQYAPDIPDDVQNVVLRGLSKDPTKRYATISEFAENLMRAAHVQLTSFNPLKELQPNKPALGVPDQAPAQVTPRRAKTKPQGSTRAADRRATPYEDDIERRIPTPRAVVKPFVDLASGADGSKYLAKAAPAEAVSRDLESDGAREKPTARSRSSKPRHPKEESPHTTVRPPRARLRAAAKSTGPREPATKVESGRIRRYSKPKVATGGSSPPSSSGKVKTQAKASDNLPQVATMRQALEKVRTSAALHQEKRALDDARSALKLAQTDRSQAVRSALSGAADLIVPILLRAVGGPKRVLALNEQVPVAQGAALEPQHMFLLSRIGSKTTIEELLDVTPLSAAETLGMLLDFVDQGFLTLK